jgi:UDP-galactopyranose mutase
MPQITLDQAIGASSRAPHGGYDYLIVGAGFAGSVIAERLAAGLGKKVLLIDRREHIGGNAYDHLDDAGVMVHRYGPHIFHTNAQRIVDYLSQFTEWRPYEHRVLARVDEHLVPIPINLTTLNTLYGLSMTSEEAEVFLAERAEPVSTIRTSEDVVINQIGRELYEKFFRGYTRKQWGLDPSDLDKSVTSRIPTRTNEDDRYFTDAFQMMPLNGYTHMFARMLDHPNIDILLDTDFKAVRESIAHRHLIYCGPIDEYYDFRFGRLPYRSLRFQHETVQQAEFQPVAVVNFPDQSVPYTRITEYKHLTGQTHPLTSISYEFPCDDGDPYYPVPRPENAELYKRYKALADETANVTFLGRLGTYKYYNMDQVVGQALALYQRIEEGHAVAPEAVGAAAS